MSGKWLFALAFGLACGPLGGCPADDDDAVGDDDAGGDDDDTMGDDDTGGETHVSGVVRDEDGLPSPDTEVEVWLEGEGAPAATVGVDDQGRFEASPIPELHDFALHLVGSGRRTVLVAGLVGGEELSLTHPAGDGEVAVTVPPLLTLHQDTLGADVTLEWTASEQPEFSAYRLMSANLGGTTILDTNVATILDPGVTSVVDPNLVQGTWFYRVFHEIDSPAGPVSVGSNVRRVDMDPDDAFPERLALVMLKTTALGGANFVNQARYAVATTSGSGVIPPGLETEVSSPLLPEPEPLAYISPQMTDYRDVEQYYYGDPAVACGRTRKIDEWDAKYAAAVDDFDDLAVVGEHRIAVGGEPIVFEPLPDGMPANRLFGVELVRDEGQLRVVWSMFEDGQPFDGGAGEYSWKYLAKIKYAGEYAGGDDPDYEWERFWSSWCLRDVGRDLGFNRVVELALNMPQNHDQIDVPDGIFAPGDEVTVALYAIATADASNLADSGVEGYGAASMYWLYAARDEVIVP